MDKKLAGLLGAAAALTTMTSAQAATPAQQPETAATSYRDLLDPVPNALAALKADDVRRSEAPSPQKGVEVAQVSVQLGHHHHHHHHHHRGIIVRVGPGHHHYHHHHHHHHHHHD
jgi:hypothetical protein